MLQRVKEVQESDLRMDGALARNIQRVIAVTQADIDAAAAQGKSWLVKRVVKVNDPLDNLRGGTQLVIKQNSIQPGQNVMRVLYSGNSKTVGPAVAPLSLPGAAADDIMALIAFGGTEQGVPDGYTLVDFIMSDANSYIETDISVNDSDEVDFYWHTDRTGSVFAFSQGASTDNAAYQLANATSANPAGVVFDIENYTPYRVLTGVNANTNSMLHIQIINKEIFIDGVSCGTSAGTLTAPTEKLRLFCTSAGVSSVSYMGRFTVKGKIDLFPCTRDSDGVVGFYDAISGTFLTNAGTGTLTAGLPAAAIKATPDNPVQIISNNGVLKFAANEANYTADNVTLGYWLRNNNGQPESSPANFYTAMMPVKPNTSYVCFGRTKDTNVISGYNRIAWYDAGGVWIRNSTYTANTPGIDTSPANAVFARFRCNPNGTEVTQELVDSYNWVFQQGTAEVPYTPYSPTKVYAAGPIETIAIKDDQDATVSTATCEDLLSVGTSTDEQEIISGVVTKKVGVMVLDGTENWQLATATNLVQFYTSGTQGVIANNVSLVSTIAPYGCTVANRTQYDFGCYSGNSGNLCFQMKGSATLTTVSAWTQYLADQYAAGTPVIVIYPLATQTTDTVTPQPMQTAAGDNTAEITQAGMAGLELEVEYVEA